MHARSGSMSLAFIVAGGSTGRVYVLRGLRVRVGQGGHLGGLTLGAAAALLAINIMANAA